MTKADKKIELNAKIKALEWVENYPCNCDKKKMPDLFHAIKAEIWNLKQQLNEL